MLSQIMLSVRKYNQILIVLCYQVLNSFNNYRFQNLAYLIGKGVRIMFSFCYSTITIPRSKSDNNEQHLLFSGFEIKVVINKLKSQRIFYSVK
jgi:hypothetical protein